MNSDLQELTARDPEARKIAEELRSGETAELGADFCARVMAQIQAQGRHHWCSAPTLFTAAASLVAILALASIFTRPLPSANYSAWVKSELTVSLGPYHPGDWYFPLAQEETLASAGEEPLCTLKAVAKINLTGME